MKACPRYLLLLFALTGTLFATAQGRRALKPELGEPNDFSPAAQQRWLDILALYDAVLSEKTKYEALPADDRAMIDSLELGYGPMTQGMDCGWYCGGQMYKVVAPSALPRAGATTYGGDNLHDFNLFTAWVPDTAGGPIGKKISFHFKPLSARVNSMTIFNGYVKNTEVYSANGRVKDFDLYINNEYYGRLLLADTTAAQTFSLPPLRSNDKAKDLVLTLVITGVYPGTKYPHVAVSEINFSGLDVH